MSSISLSELQPGTHDQEDEEWARRVVDADRNAFDQHRVSDVWPIGMVFMRVTLLDRVATRNVEVKVELIP